MNAGVQVDEDSLLGLEMHESDLSVDEDIPADNVLLCILGALNGIEVTFLIDSGPSECFLSTSLVEKNKIKNNKNKRKIEYSACKWNCACFKFDGRTGMCDIY